MANNGVKVTLGTETFVLGYTLNAFRDVPALCDGYMGAYAKLSQADPNVCIAIIAAGTGKAGDAKEFERIAELLFEYGMVGVIPALTEYVGMLQVGGKVRTEAQSGTPGE